MDGSNDPFGLDDFNFSGGLDVSDSGNYDFDGGDFSFGGNDTNDKIDIDSFDGDLGDIGNGYDNMPNDSGDKNKIIKTAIFAIGAGLLIVIIAFSVNRVGRNKSNKSSNTTTKKQVEKSVSDIATVSQRKNDWVQFGTDDVIEFETTLTSSFTITEIKHYALVTNSSNDKQLKSVLKGNISGLVGTYEIEIPFEKAQKLDVGTVFEVSYKMKKLNGYSVISSIEY